MGHINWSIENWNHGPVQFPKTNSLLKESAIFSHTRRSVLYCFTVHTHCASPLSLRSQSPLSLCSCALKPVLLATVSHQTRTHPLRIMRYSESCYWRLVTVICLPFRNFYELSMWFVLFSMIFVAFSSLFWLVTVNDVVSVWCAVASPRFCGHSGRTRYTWPYLCRTPRTFR